MAKASAASVPQVKPIVRKLVTMTIKSKSPMIQHAWTDKAKQMMRDKHQGKKTRNREIRQPEEEGKAASYKTADGAYGIPLLALKASLLSAAHKDLGMPRTLVSKALFIPAVDTSGILPIECEEPSIEEDCVRVGQGAADLRYRPYFMEWSCRVTFEIDAELLTTNDLIHLVGRAGFGVGICEWRPEKGGEYGRYEIDTSAEITEELIKDGS